MMLDGDDTGTDVNDDGTPSDGGSADAEPNPGAGSGDDKGREGDDKPFSFVDRLRANAGASSDDDDDDEGGKPGDKGAGPGKKDTKPADGAGTGDDKGKGGGTGDDDDGDEPVTAPSGWSIEDREAFGRAPKDVQKVIARREDERNRDYQQKVTRIAPVAQVYERWGQHLESVAQGRPVTDVLDDLIAIDHVMRTGTNQQKMELLGRMVRGYGIDITDGADPNHRPSPTEQRLQAQVQQLTQTVSQLTQGVQTQTDAQWQGVVQQIAAAEKELSEAKNEDGSPKYPYLLESEIQEAMLPKVEAALAAGNQPDLAAIYEDAVWGVRKFRERKLAAQSKETADKKQRERDDKLRKAKRAGRSVSGSGSPVKADKPFNFRDRLREHHAA